jgi:uncharacterized membrane protein
MNDESLKDINLFKRDAKREAWFFSILGIVCLCMAIFFIWIRPDDIIAVALFFPTGIFLALLSLNEFHVINYHLDEAFKKAREKKGIVTVLVEAED